MITKIIIMREPITTEGGGGENNNDEYNKQRILAPDENNVRLARYEKTFWVWQKR